MGGSVTTGRKADHRNRSALVQDLFDCLFAVYFQSSLTHRRADLMQLL